jgi:hypothetical protein
VSGLTDRKDPVRLISSNFGVASPTNTVGLLRLDYPVEGVGRSQNLDLGIYCRKVLKPLSVSSVDTRVEIDLTYVCARACVTDIGRLETAAGIAFNCALVVPAFVKTIVLPYRDLEFTWRLF